jgi:hypothetical protein
LYFIVNKGKKETDKDGSHPLFCTAPDLAEELLSQPKNFMLLTRKCTTMFTKVRQLTLYG